MQEKNARGCGYAAATFTGAIIIFIAIGISK
jgi:hypothetical protein